MLGFDIVAIFAAYGLMAWLRYESARPDVPWAWVLGLAAVVAGVYLLLGFAFKTYLGRVAVATVEETLFIGFGAFLGVVCAQLVNTFGHGASVARSVPLAAGCLSLALMLTGRALWRRLAERIGYVEPSADSKRAVIVGAGETAEALVRSIWSTPGSPFVPVALLDDDRWKRHRRIEGVPVAGRVMDLESVVRRERAEVVIVAIHNASNDFLARIDEAAEAAGAEVKVVPSVAEMFDEEVTIRDVRDINMADILGRKPIETDVAEIAHIIKGKRVLVTGAGGSIGSELCRQIARWEPAELMMLDRDESALHGVQLTLSGHGLLHTDEVILSDIRDSAALNRIFDERRPEVVFHAAALKHLPMLEQYPLEGFKTNVLGTLNVLEAARRVGVERFVNISTDKAADPTSILGLSKRVAERITAGYARRSDGIYLSVRFGNVLGSRGSVLTAWTAQIAAGGPLTVTDKDVTRYFMTIAEACQLVLQAGAIGSAGEALILDMGEPVRLDDVARALIAKSGKPIDIIYTGLREGEKMDEILIAHDEGDNRPHHHLITHVAVPPLVDGVVLEVPERASFGEARDLLALWCTTGDTATLAIDMAAVDAAPRA
ncbi:nucleoside-diphosphate sugar epimerase/dehydratase [Nocardioides jejuensis]|uniref:Polysaccharide biosynthesis protein n=1 Tax=Nocardioides jejuensis TaxID=2502782 RepID=A0A4R1CG60_9ACTN|nr:nucleoside-diphosphate sugar epimerase/dehydratase [Nocardioides jejuensis]TCJ30200.1 polysaccharide biosynthesis protein [Nocardioides jejuensis]